MNLYVNEFDPQYTLVHSSEVKHDIPKMIRAMMAAGSLNQTKLAKKLGKGVTQPQVSRWLAGQEPEVSNYQRIVALAEQMGVLSDVRSEDVAALMAEQPQAKGVRIIGYVGAGSEAHFYRVADEDFVEVPAPPDATDQTVAVEIRGKSWGPMMESWLVFYENVQSPVTENMHGQPCVVGLADDRILIKKIEKQRNGLYRLVSNSDEPPIEDVEIEWAALITSMRPRR